MSSKFTKLAKVRFTKELRKIMQNVTTKKFAEMCNVSDANIRGLIARGSIEAQKDSSGNHLIDIENEKNRKYLDAKRTVTQSITQEVLEDTQEVMSKDFATISQQIERLAKQAGKAEMLEDSIIKNQNDVKYWQDKYFELQDENKQYYERVTQLDFELRNSQKENSELLDKQSELVRFLHELEKENEGLKAENSKPFWKRKIL